MRGGDRHRHARLADRERAQPVDDAHVAHPPPLAAVGGDPLHEGQGHLLVRLVLEAEDAAALVVVAHDAHEEAQGAVAGAGGLERGDVDRRAHEADAHAAHASTPG